MSALQLNVAVLAAVAVAMAKQDVRYYLNGVCVDRDEAGRVALAATDGHAMLVARDCEIAWEGEGAAQLILPRDFVAAILKAAKRETVVTVDATEAQGADARVFDLSATIGATTLRARSIDGRFPDWRQAMRPTLHAKVGATMAAFAPAVLAVATDAAQAFAKVAGIKKHGAVSVQFIAAGDQSTGFAIHGCHGAVIAGVVMPLRDTAAEAPTVAAIRDALGEPEPEPMAAAA